MKFLFHCSQILREPKNCKKGTQTQRGPNFERKGDQKGTFFDVKGDLKFESELFTKSKKEVFP